MERLNTGYIDAFYMHKPPNVAQLKHRGFFSAIDILKSEGKVKYVGLSSHGGGRNGDSMEKILLAAVEDGRFDMMLFIYNFMNKDVAEKVLAACKKKNIGTTAMKTAPGALKFDPNNLTDRQNSSIERAVERGRSREEIIDRMEKSQNRNYEKSKSFIDKYGILTQEQLRMASINWVIQNPDMHTTCVSFSDFDFIDKVVLLSGTKLSLAGESFLNEYKYAFNNQYCRHGCSECRGSCPVNLPVSSIMRYAYYFEGQNREKEAMIKYANLKGADANNCQNCDAPCSAACPNGLDIKAQLLRAHSILGFRV